MASLLSAYDLLDSAARKRACKEFTLWGLILEVLQALGFGVSL
jgi:hypothetical protein